MRSRSFASFRGTTGSRVAESVVNQGRHETAKQLEEILNTVGFENCELIVGIDFTRSNQWNGKESFGGKCLHDVSGSENPYMAALRLLAPRSERLDDDRSIPCYGFGDARTGRNGVFSLFRNNGTAQGLESLMKRYKQIVPSVDMSGPTTFAPLIHQAMRDVHESGMKFHVLLILADGQVSNECLDDTKSAIVLASKFPMSIVMVGVGDGPWEAMETFDNSIADREWDNFQFVEFNTIVKRTPNPQEGRHEELMFEKVFEEIPEQLQATRKLLPEYSAAQAQTIINSLPKTAVSNPPDV